MGSESTPASIWACSAGTLSPALGAGRKTAEWIWHAGLLETLIIQGYIQRAILHGQRNSSDMYLGLQRSLVRLQRIQAGTGGVDLRRRQVRLPRPPRCIALAVALEGKQPILRRQPRRRRSMTIPVSASPAAGSPWPLQMKTPDAWPADASPAGRGHCAYIRVVWQLWHAFRATATTIATPFGTGCWTSLTAESPSNSSGCCTTVRCCSAGRGLLMVK